MDSALTRLFLGAGKLTGKARKGSLCGPPAPPWEPTKSSKA